MKHSSLLCLTLAVSLFWACDTTAQNLPKTDIPSPELNRNSFSDNSYQIAGVYHIVDYSKKMEGRWGKRVNDEGKNAGNRNCHTYGLQDECGSHMVGKGVKHPIVGLTCYEECVCDTSYYQYSASNCASPKVLSEDCTLTDGTVSVVRYAQCKCPNEYDLSTCPEGGVCDKCNGKFKQTGCGEDYMQSGDICVKKEHCEEYPLEGDCPEGCNCSACPDNSGKYKIDGAQDSEGWSWSAGQTSCEAVPCPAGYARGVTECSDTVNYTYSSKGKSGGQVCGKCVGKVFDKNIVKLGVTALADNSTLSFSLSGSGYAIDWGDGTRDNNSSHTYAKAGDYVVVMTEGITKLGAYPSYTTKITKLYTLDMDTITSAGFSSNCDKLTGSIPNFPPNLTYGGNMFARCYGLTGSIPELPSSLIYGNYMFERCYRLTGNIPELPPNLTKGSYMFSTCSGLTGTIPELPSSLTGVTSMFSGCTGLTGTIPELPSTLTDGDSMFSGCTGLTGSIPELPSTLTKGNQMFSTCSGLTGTIPELPSTLKYGSYMFSGCTGLTGSIPRLPSTLTDGGSMFSNCTGLTGTIPELPSSLTDGRSMFWGCSGLTGDIPQLPSTLTLVSGIFYHCSGLTGNIPELPSTLTSGDNMFNGCSGLTGNIPQLPSTLKYGNTMFNGCSSLTGSIPELPSTLTSGENMFSGCSGLTGTIPELPSSLTSGGWMFDGCTKLTGTAPAKPANLTNCSYIFRGTKVTKTSEWSSCK